MNDDEYMAAERRATAVVRLMSHREVEQAVREARAAGLTPTEIAYHCGRTRQWVHGILRKPTAIHHINGDPRDNHPENLEIVDVEAHARPVAPTAADRTWTCHECDARITDVQPETWLAVPCGHYVTHVQMVTMTYGQPSWPVTFDPARTAKPTEETPS